ncbi:TPA: phenylalanine--tRNA ligase subunit beta [Candidatus Daviesbacteria bacterium]|nr:MAG: phenylalanine--tRNA ligase subunit beta [Candidatus Daviesbacteria bacterium RIFCSPLOWO2_12_FULL_38_10]HCB22898.1 phenylalanine--tRNA ligase subunit beta [Candidatus Daviesbacteria bacterium]
MKVSINWLQELVDLKISLDELINLLPLRSISIKEVTDDLFELDMKGYNRADLLSLRGVAREVAAITNSQIKFSEEKNEFPDLPKVEVVIDNEKLCPVYCVAKIENLKVEHSNGTWVKKLFDSGIRSINNAADVTNLIMLEYGQPMHAFDAKKVRGSVRVRMAEKREKINTLDGKIRELSGEDLLIADESVPIGIAGVMGGKDSEVSESTTSIFLEAAIFDPVSIRKTAQRHNLPSEASKRFQYGLTKTNLLQALSAAIRMYEGLGGKLTAITLIGDLEDQPKIIELTREKVNSLIGINIPKNQIEKSLQSLGCHLRGVRTNLWEVEIPYWRLDINTEEDLIEEVARMYGYENIPAKALPDFKLTKFQDPLIYNLKKTLADLGLTEVQTYSFYSSKTINDLRLTIYDLVKIANPISTETEYMRDNLWPNLLEVAAKNVKNGFKDVAIFEIGKVYEPPQKETYRLSIALMNGTDNPLQELNQIFQQLLKNIKISLGAGVIHPPGEQQQFHPTRFTDNMAEVHPRIVNKFGIDNRVAVLEVEIDTLIRKEPFLF